jgi:hypothetical protein
MKIKFSREYYCQFCGDIVREENLRSHYAVHAPEAISMSEKDLLRMYEPCKELDLG